MYEYIQCGEEDISLFSCQSFSAKELSSIWLVCGKCHAKSGQDVAFATLYSCAVVYSWSVNTPWSVASALQRGLIPRPWISTQIEGHKHTCKQTQHNTNTSPYTNARTHTHTHTHAHTHTHTHTHTRTHTHTHAHIHTHAPWTSTQLQGGRWLLGKRVVWWWWEWWNLNMDACVWVRACVQAYMW